MTKPTLEELVAEAIAPPIGCAAITGDARAFLDLVKERRGRGENVRTQAVHAILKREWDVRVGDDTIRKHLAGLCNCEVAK